nr:MAG TPA: hypothetical protein [Bacteriophage sp.]
MSFPAPLGPVIVISFIVYKKRGEPRTSYGTSVIVMAIVIATAVG